MSHTLYRSSYLLYRPSADRTRYSSCAVSTGSAHAVVLAAVGIFVECEQLLLCVCVRALFCGVRVTATVCVCVCGVGATAAVCVRQHVIVLC